MSLLVIQNDREYVQIRRRGRFAMDEAQAGDPRHRTAAEKVAKSKMIRNMRARGFEYVDDGRDELRGPFPHLDFSEDDRPDHAHLAAPDWRDMAAQARWEREEKTRQARDVPGASQLVDFRIVATFRKATGQSFRALTKTVR